MVGPSLAAGSEPRADGRNAVVKSTPRERLKPLALKPDLQSLSV